jgi:hypothetical protein
MSVDETEKPRPPGRTPSRIALDLSKLSLPEPSAITDAAKRSERESKVRELNNQLAKLDLDEPSAVSTEERELGKERAREALLQVIAAMELGEPEEVLRANLRADGKKTPEKMCVLALVGAHVSRFLSCPSIPDPLPRSAVARKGVPLSPRRVPWTAVSIRRARLRLLPRLLQHLLVLLPRRVLLRVIPPLFLRRLPPLSRHHPSSRSRI